MSIDGKQIYLLNYESAIVYTNTTQQEANTNGSVIFSPLYPISINQNLVATSGLSQSISCYFYPVL
ncbi:MAG: hypothetical protein LBC61_05155 [Candidatus Peribacteria bacterium]|jgi:hypothetical protein|nr:hypothetical protein [Candidatus Peribacteria bacterium]